MPIITSDYNPPMLFRNGHFSTIYSGLIRKISAPKQHRERIVLADGDFLDVDWCISANQTDKVVLLLHGLEGNAQRAYITGSAKLFLENSYDVCAINLRGCSGVPNNTFRSYHSGATEDLEAIIQYVLEKKNYNNIFCKGFSLGGNLLLKFLGENNALAKEITAAVAISVPCDLHNSLLQLLKPKNLLYAKRFKKKLIEKLKQKQVQFSNNITNKEISDIKTLLDFDNYYTSKAHGFKNALDYYQKSSSKQYLPFIKTPTLLINAKNDSFLGAECYPITEAENNSNLFLEMPKYGGHVGFYGKNNITYTEKKALVFINAYH